MAKKGLIDFGVVKEQADFAAVLAHYGVTVPGNRVQIKVLCPLPGHEETSPSCSINTVGKVFHCFGCAAEGNVVDFVMLKEGSDNPAVGARKLAEICGFEVPRLQGALARRAAREAERACAAGEEARVARERPSRGPRKPQDEREGSRTAKGSSGPDDGSVEPPVDDPGGLVGNTPLTFSLRLDPAHPYREQRGGWLTPEVVAEFGLGFCNRGLMKGRWCIPIHSGAGELVAYAGRWVGPDETIPAGKGKYELPPRGKFDRSRELFNLHRAVALGCSHVWVVEGFFGAMRLHAERGEPVVATMGNSISPIQLTLLAERFEKATVLYDGGENGRRAAESVALQMCRHLPTMITDLPDGEQPDTIGEDVLDRL